MFTLAKQESVGNYWPIQNNNMIFHHEAIFGKNRLTYRFQITLLKTRQKHCLCEIIIQLNI